MPLSKPLAALCSCQCRHPAAVPAFPSITSSFWLNRRRPWPHGSPPQPHRRARTYAAVNGQGLPDWPASPHPTPYEIFAMAKDAPYTKKRFYELVKLYHPDTHDHHHGNHSRPAPSLSPSHGLPHATRLERYRLVVAANDLLSDPAKRQLYDCYGLGWTGGRAQSLRETVREADRSWRHRPGSAAANATWEDWERWHDARAGKPKEPLYMSNGLFATVVVMMCMVGAFAQMSRADHAGVEYMEATNQSSVAIGKQLSQTNRASAGLSKNERVDTFLRDRENVSYQFVPAKYDSPEEGKT